MLMKVSESWLREWVNPTISGEDLAAQLTMAGLEVDARVAVAGQFDKVVVAEVLRTTPHPQADKLTLCEVSTGNSETLKIVCGARNVRQGLRVALALPGANLPGGICIKETKLRGEPSQGMLCSTTELGMEESSEGIFELPTDAPIGADLRDYLSLDDYVLDIDLTPNRADCFSIFGVAREVAALSRVPMNHVPANVIPPVIDETMTVNIDASEACPQYCGRIIRHINPKAETPLWMKERLRRCGVRPLHPVVDVTNYVMFELGQPLHAFDLQKIQGNITVRFAEPKETLELLNGQHVTLNEKVLVIADSHKALAMAGVMGGEESAVSEETVDIFLESAFFNPITIAGIARQFALSSDSSQRFERGVDPALQTRALERATELILQICGGNPGPGIVTNKPKYLPGSVQLKFKPEKVQRLSGVQVSSEEMQNILHNLGIKVTALTENEWMVCVPSHRFDIQLEVDLVEEIVRLYGYDHIVTLPMISTVRPGSINVFDQLSTQIAIYFSHRGYQETISYSFVDPDLQQEIYPNTTTLELLNPISKELSQMRAGMWPGLIASMLYNLHRQQTAIKLFETGVVFDVQDSPLRERSCVAGLLMGAHAHLNWSESARKYDFFDLKGDLQALFLSLHIEDVEYIAASHPALHPGKSAKITIDQKDAGWLGVLHPKLLDALDIQEEVMVFELDLEKLLRTNKPKFESISKYPQIRRDLSFLVGEEVSAKEIERAVNAVAPTNLLKSFDVFDVYVGESIPKGQKSMAISFTLQDDTKTLIDAEIIIIIDAIIKKLNNEFAILLRD
jgi:phenylalanyl-tRNA synthetase beta chain